nr:probable membrane-associated kinase regulator 2 [Ipomoea batatas]
MTFSTSSASSVDRTDPDVSLSPSDDLFFKGRLVPVESSSLLLNETEANSKFPVSLAKTATKFRVLMLKLKKPKANAEQKPEKSEPDGVNPAKPSPKGKPENEKDESQSRPEKKLFTVRFKVEEVNIKSLFTRDNSSKNANNGKAAQKTNAEDSHSSNVDSNSSSSSLAEEKKFSKEMMQKYLKMVKPLYIRVSKRYGEKLRFSGQLSLSGAGAGAKAALVASPPPPQPTAEKGEAEAAEVAEKTAVLSNVKSLKQGNLPAGLRVVRKHLRKSRSAPSPVVSSSGELSSRRRDDSLLQQQDGIQSAILHCKRSFNSTRDSNMSILSRTTSDASHEKPINLLAVADDSSSPKEVKPQSETPSCRNQDSQFPGWTVVIPTGSFPAIKSLPSRGTPIKFCTITMTVAFIFNVRLARAFPGGTWASPTTLPSYNKLIVASSNLNDAALGFFTDTPAKSVRFTLGLRFLVVRELRPSIWIESILTVGSFTRKTVNANIRITIIIIKVTTLQHAQHLMHLRFFPALLSGGARAPPFSTSSARWLCPETAGASGWTCSCPGDWGVVVAIVN